jgi:tRNA dimethylallyltransferase
MLEQGVLAEVESLLDEKIPRSTPVFKALGALQLADYLEGLITLEKALEKTRKITHNYIKRQQTWFRHQLATPYRIDDFYCEDTFRYVQSVIKEFNY